jgi:indole-3-glycerol phosphate synthase
VSGSVLGDILAAKRRRIAAGQFSARSAEAARASAEFAPTPEAKPDGARFAAALSSSLSKQILPSSLPAFLCEIKHRSPSAGLILPDAPSRIEAVAGAYRRGGASALSVGREPDFFGGDPSGLARA